MRVKEHIEKRMQGLGSRVSVISLVCAPFFFA